MSIVGCTPAPDRARHSVEDYRKSPELRHVESARCANDPGSLKDTPDCINAREAERIEGIGSLKNLPPLQLPPKTG
jgi:hypothetical protein